MKNIFRILFPLIAIINAQNDMTVLFQYFDESVDIYVEEDEIVISADGVPSHLSPYFPETFNDSQNGLYYFEDQNNDGLNDWFIDPHDGMNVNPNQIGLQDYEFRIPLNPEINSQGPTDTFLGAIGVSLNGVPLYNEYEGPTAQLDPQTILSFDLAQGHPAPGGSYHYHFPPESLFVTTEDNFIGFAADGFPVYGPKNIDGYNVENLDDYHAEFGPTPDFPDGIYHYHTTYTSPYIIGAFAGTIGTGFGGGGGGGGGGGVVDCLVAPPNMPCCGDGICGGPENENNCSEDCLSGNQGPNLFNFSIVPDTINVSQESSSVGYIIGVEHPDNYLLNYTVRLIINGGINNGGEMIESSGDFNDSVMSTTVAGSIEIPLGSTEGHWNIRIILRDIHENVSNIGPTQLENQNFQNYIYIINSELNYDRKISPTKEFSISGNYPNPFNPITSINFSVAKKTRVKITIYNIMGVEVAILLNKIIHAGTRSISWNAKEQSSGVYYVHMQADAFNAYRKVLLIK